MIPNKFQSLFKNPSFVRALHWALVLAWGWWIVGTRFHLPFVLGDERDGGYHALQVMELRQYGAAGLHVNHPFLFVFYLDFVTRLFCSMSVEVLRGSMIVFALGTGLVVYETGRILLKRPVDALLSAMTLFYIAVYAISGQRVSHEAPTGFFMALTFFFMVRALSDRRPSPRRDVVLAAVSTFIACEFNFTGYFLGAAWLGFLWELPRPERRFAFAAAAVSFGAALVAYLGVAIAARPNDLAEVMAATGRQRMVFGATPDGHGRITYAQWFWYAYVKRLGWVNPLALAAAGSACAIASTRLQRGFFLVTLLVAHLNIFVFSSGALGWICYFYFFAIPLSLAPWAVLESAAGRWPAISRPGLRTAATVAMIAALYGVSQPFVKKAFITPGAAEFYPEWEAKLAALDRWFVTKPDVQPLYERLRAAAMSAAR